VPTLQERVLERAEKDICHKNKMKEKSQHGGWL